MSKARFKPSMPATPAPIMFTVDVESDWAGDKEVRGISEALPLLLDLLQRHAAKATFFVVANLVELVRELLLPDGPHEVGSHGLTHRLLPSLSPAEMVEEVYESKRVLESAGYRVDGFRAPFFSSPPSLPSLLSKAGYRYDASGGALYPGHKNRSVAAESGNGHRHLPRVETSYLRDGWTPFSLTYLRLYHPVGLALTSDKATLFYCHLHELVDGSKGWDRLPFPLRQLQLRNSGCTARRILERLFERFGQRFVSCREYLATAQRH